MHTVKEEIVKNYLLRTDKKTDVDLNCKSI
jgi:hypothetical protein